MIEFLLVIQNVIEELVRSFRVNDSLIVLDNINNKNNIIYIIFKSKKRIFLIIILKNIYLYKYTIIKKRISSKDSLFSV